MCDNNMCIHVASKDCAICFGILQAENGPTYKTDSSRQCYLKTIANYQFSLGKPKSNTQCLGGVCHATKFSSTYMYPSSLCRASPPTQPAVCSATAANMGIVDVKRMWTFVLRGVFQQRS